jgi:hypothetical protein
MSGAARAFALVGALALEAAALARLRAGAGGAALLLHVGSAGLFAEWSRRPGGARSALVGWLWAALFPIYGVAIALGLPRAPVPRGKREEEPWERQRRQAAHTALEARRQAQTIGANVLPLMDALLDRDPRLRASAVDTLRDARSRWAVALLARERDNDVYDVRFRAVEALGRVGARYLEALAEARHQLAAGADRFATHRQFAELLLEYAKLDLEDARIRRVYLEDAKRHAEAALDERDDTAVRLLLAAIHLRLDSPGDAAAAYRDVLTAEPDHPDALSGMAEIYLRRRDFAALRSTCVALHRAGHLSLSRLRELSRFWRDVEAYK